MLVALNLGFAAAIVASQLVDRDRVAASVLRAFEKGDLTIEDYPPLPLPALNASRRFVDRFTECWSLGLAVLGDPDALVVSAASAPTLAPPARGTLCRSLQTFVASGAWREHPQPMAYFAYWHGAQVLVRPLLAVADVETLGVVNRLLLGLAALWLAVEVGRTLGGGATLVLLGCIFVLGDAANATAVTAHALGIAVAFAAAASMARSVRRPADTLVVSCWIALLGGAAFDFVDFLVNPPLGPTLLAVIVLAERLSRDASTPAAVGRAVARAWLVAIVWFVSYAFTWCCRWIFAIALLGSNEVITNVYTRAAFRVSGDSAGVRQVPFAAIRANVDRIGAGPLLTVSAIALLSLVVALRRSQERRVLLLGFAAFCSVSAIPMLWFEVLRNHSQIHAWFTFRSLSVAAAGLLLAVRWTLARSAPTMPRTPRISPFSSRPDARSSSAVDPIAQSGMLRRLASVRPEERDSCPTWTCGTHGSKSTLLSKNTGLRTR